jgi:hypothetical protein
MAMRLMSFLRPDGTPSWGVLSGETVSDLLDRAPGLKAALAAAASLAPTGMSWRLDDVAFLPPIPDPDKIICVGLNYLSHIREGGREPPKQPTIFTRWANTQVGHEQPLIRPHASATLDYEGELAVVIGRSCRHVGAAEAGTVRRLCLLQRRQRARVAAPFQPVHPGQELPQHRRLRPLDRHPRRDGRDRETNPGDPAERGRSAARHP